MDFDRPLKVRRGLEKRLAAKIAREIVDKYELKILKQYISGLPVSKEDADQILLLAAQLLDPPGTDGELVRYRRERRRMISQNLEKRIKNFGSVYPMGVLNFLCGNYKREVRTVGAAAAELIAEERHGDMCCLIAGEYIEKRKHILGSKLIAVHLVINGESVSLYDGTGREITLQYSSYIPQEDRLRYTHSDLVLSAMVDIAPRNVYVYGGETNLKLLRRIQLMFSNVFLCEARCSFKGM